MKPLTPERIKRMELAYARRLRKSERNDPPWGQSVTPQEYVAAHEGWTQRLKRQHGYISARNDEEVYENQCGGCRFYFPIEGASSLDWGACGNPASDRIGTVVFEHHGCPQHSQGHTA